MKVNAFSHAGKLRDGNEDSLLVREADGLYVVADGMGGHAGGEVASKMTVDTLGYTLGRVGELVAHPHTVLGMLSAALVAAITTANASVLAQSKADTSLHGMGSTVVTLLVTSGAIVVAHVGDSRAYVLREGKLFQLTVDHSVGEDLIATGTPRHVIDRAPPGHMYGHLTQAVGVQDHVHVTTAAFMPMPGDVYLLCSDGLYNELDVKVIAKLLALDDPAPALLAATLATKARDNVSGIVVKF